MVAITADAEEKKKNIIESSIAQQQFMNDKFNEFILQTNNNDVDLVQQYSADVQALNTALQEKKISYTQYQEELKALEDTYAKDSIEAELAKQRKLVEVGNLSPAEKREALIKIANLEKELSDATTKGVLDNEEKKRQKLKETPDIAKQVTDEIMNAVQSILNGNIEAQKNATQQEIDDINRKKVS